jgi:cell pole-organizing protein PopZ
MADEAQAPPPNAPSGQEPSMEEILASIRKIIADDEPAKTDVVELTQMVQEDGSVTDLKAAAAPEVSPPPPPAAPPPEPPKAEAAPPPPPSSPPPRPPMPAPPADTLVSAPAAASAASALSSLANTVEIERLAAMPPMTTTFIGNNARTLEEMTIGLMKPLLKEWLDQNLPNVVDRLVQKEIERITNKVKD